MKSTRQSKKKGFRESRPKTFHKEIGGKSEKRRKRKYGHGFEIALVPIN